MNDADFARCLSIATEFLDNQESIRNSNLREIAGIGYDQAIRFFNRAVDEGRLERKGKSSGTHYTLPGR
jgi:hypothetical protein